MSATEQSAAKKSPLLERLGVQFLSQASVSAVRAASTAGAEDDAGTDAIHLLNPKERAALRAIERGAIVRAAAAGAINALLTGFAEVLAHPLLGDPNVEATTQQQLTFWAVFGGASLVFAIAEIVFLYWDALRSVRALAIAAGLELAAPGDSDGKRLERQEVALALARAALELPSPAEPAFGVDPRREASRLRLAFASIIYKLKVSVSNFLFKALIRRALGRLATRTLLAFLAVPVNALWNAVVCAWVLREARLRVMGPSAIIEMVRAIFEVEEGQPQRTLSEEAKHSAVRAVGAAIVRSYALHPNLAALLIAVRAHVGELEDGVVLDDSRLFLTRLAGLPRDEQDLVLRVLTAAAIVDGRLTGDEKRLLREARAACGRSPDLSGARRLCKAFVSGDPIATADVRSTA